MTQAVVHVSSSFSCPFVKTQPSVTNIAELELQVAVILRPCDSHEALAKNKHSIDSQIDGKQRKCARLHEERTQLVPGLG